MASDAYIEAFEAGIPTVTWPRIVDAAQKIMDTQIELKPSRVAGFRYGHLANSTWSNPCAIIFWTDSGSLVGGETHRTPYVTPEYRGYGLGRELCRLVFELGYKRISDPAFFSPGGLGSRMAAHREAVHDAVMAGLPVPAKVLKDYPDLYEQFKGADEPPLNDESLPLFSTSSLGQSPAP